MGQNPKGGGGGGGKHPQHPGLWGTSILRGGSERERKKRVEEGIKPWKEAIVTYSQTVTSERSVRGGLGIQTGIRDRKKLQPKNS